MSNTAIAERQSSEVTDMAQMIERLVMSPDVDVAKLEQLLAMQERIQARQAAREYSEAMNEAQAEMSVVSQDAANPQTRSKYASYAALDRAIRPIYTKHGFGPSFDTADAPENMVRVVCKISHRGGHIETRHIDIPADGKGAKGGDVMTKTHATISAVSYGRRALLKMIFNIAEGKETDDDGNRAGSDGGVVSEEQVAELRALIMDVDADLPKLLAYLKVERLEDIFADKFETVKRVIEQKRGKAAS